MIDAEFCISDPVVEHVPDDNEQRVLKRDDGTQGAGMGLDAPVFHGKIGRFRPGHGQGRDSGQRVAVFGVELVDVAADVGVEAAWVAPVVSYGPVFEQQRYRVSGLNLLTAAIVLWNTVYLDRAITTLNSADTPPAPELLRYLSPLSWEHINLTGNYTWPRAAHKPGQYRPLRRPTNR